MAAAKPAPASPAPDGLEGLRALLMQTPAVVWVLKGPRHVVALANPRARQSVGDRAGLEGRPFVEAVPELRDSEEVALLDRVYATGEPVTSAERRLVVDLAGAGDAEESWFDYVLQPTRDRVGAIDGVMVHAFDVTDQVRARRVVEDLAAELGLERERLRAVMDQMPVGVVLAEAPGGRLILGNRRVEEIWRMPFLAAAEVGEYDGYVGFHPDGRRLESHEWPLARAITTGEVVHGERVEILRGDGERGTLALSAGPIRDGTGHIVAGVVTFQDVTDRERSERRAALLAEASSALAGSLDAEALLDGAARMAVAHLADACAIDLARPDEPPRRVAAVGRDAALDAAVRRLPVLRTPRPDLDVMGTGGSVLLQEVSDEMLASIAESPEHLALLRSLDLRSVLAVALTARGSVLGRMTLGRCGDGRRFDAQDLEAAEELARRVALALENAHLYEAQSAARAVAERAQERDAFLAEVTLALDTPLGTRERLHRLAETLVPRFADLCTLELLEPDGELRMITAAAAKPELEHHLREVRARYSRPVTCPDSIAWVLHSGEPLLVPDISPESLAAYARESVEPEVVLASLRALASTSSVVVPLTAREQVIGVLSLGTVGRPRFTEDDLGLAAELGRRAGLAVENARLYEAERRARERVSRLQAVTAALSRALTPAEVASVVVAEGLAALEASGGSIAVREGDGARLLRAVGYPPEIAERYARFPLTAPIALAEAMRSGRPLWFRSRAEWEARYGTPQVAPLPSGGATPLVVADRIIGAVSFRFAEEDRELTEEELAFVATLAQQCAQALERARVYEQQRRVAAALQESLLPRELPRVPGAALAVRYLPAARGLDVGGDWYEAVRLPDGRLALAVGDVVGRGLEAASVMGQLRSALRAFALIDHRPACVLDRLSAFAETVDGASVTTVVYLVLDPTSGEAHYAAAGHPPPLVVDPQGGTRFLTGGRAAPLATHGGAQEEGTFTLEPDSTVLLFSDGAIERRGEVLDDGLARLARLAADGPLSEPGALCDHILGDLFADEPPADDVAMLAVRILGAPVPPLLLDVPARADQLAVVRREVGTWLGRLGASSEDAWDVLVACGEACANAIEHAYAGDGDPAGDARDRALVVEMEHEGGDAILMRVRDRGTWRPRQDPDLRGRGLLLMRKTMDDVRLDRGPGGTTVTLRRRLGAGGSGSRAEILPMPRSTAPGLQVEVASPGGPRAVLRLEGEIDTEAARGLERRLAESGRDGLLGLVLDLSGVTFLDSAGVRVLLRLARDCEVTGRRLWIVCPPGTPTRRVLELSGADVLLTLEDVPVEDAR